MAPVGCDRDAVQQERRASLGEVPNVMRAEVVTDGVLQMSAAFDRFDQDASGGISATELRAALEYLGVRSSDAQAAERWLRAAASNGHPAALAGE